MPDMMLNLFLCIAAMAYHFVEKWFEYRTDVAKIGIVEWVKLFPAMTAMVFLGTIVAFTGAYAIDWMNPGMAIASGYMGDSVVRRIVGKVMQ